jgi:anti-sigma B factor antagonist
MTDQSVSSRHARRVDRVPFDGGFRCDVVHERARVRIVVAGELDLMGTPRSEQTLRTFLYTGFGRVVLDLRRLSFIDSTGLALVLRYAEAARRAGLCFGLIPGPPAVQRIFELTGTNVLFDFEPELPRARTLERH